MKYAFISLGVFLFVVPISVKARLFLSVSDKKIYYSVFLYNVFRLNSGYVSFRKKYLVINYSDKKALAISYKSMLKPQLLNPDLKRFELLQIKNIFILGGTELKDVFISAAISSLNAGVYAVLRDNKPYLDYRSDVYLSNDDRYGLLNESEIAFNLLILTEMLLQKLIGSVIELCKKTIQKIKSKI